MVGPRALTANTRPPAVTSASPSQRVPAWNTWAPSTAAASPTPVITSPVRGATGYPSLANTTVTQASSVNSIDGKGSPAADARHSAPRSDRNRGTTTSHSGSPKRTLYSSIFGPDVVSITPAYST